MTGTKKPVRESPEGVPCGYVVVKACRLWADSSLTDQEGLILQGKKESGK
jgi:hypothetical protein